jgi:hypothetical protein
LAARHEAILRPQSPTILHLMRKLFSVLVLLAVTVPAAAQQSKPFDFSIKNIMRGPELYGRQPADVRWSADSKWIYFTWLEPGTDWREQPKQFRVRAVPGAKPERVSIQQIDSTGSRFARPEPLHNGRYSAVEFNGDIYINDLTAGTTRRLTQTVEAERSPKFSADDRQIFFVRSNNLFSIDLGTGFLHQLTDIRSGPAPVADSARAQGQRGRLEQQQRDLFRIGAGPHPGRRHCQGRAPSARFARAEADLPPGWRAGVRLLDLSYQYLAAAYDSCGCFWKPHDRHT